MGMHEIDQVKYMTHIEGDRKVLYKFWSKKLPENPDLL